MRFFEEIANRESRNENQIVLYPEGLFYKAYDRSAFACVSRIPTFKPSKKRIKYCAREVASIGFPATALPKYFPTAPRPLPDGRVVIALKDRIDADACRVWKTSLPLKERRPRGSSKLKAYRPIGRDGRTGTLFVHPEDLLPDAPVAFSTGTKGPEQPVRLTGGRGAVERSETPGTERPARMEELRGGYDCREPLRAGQFRPAFDEAPRQPEQTTGGKGAVEVSEARRVGRFEAYRPKWLRRIACKVLGITELPQTTATPDPSMRPRNEQGVSGKPEERVSTTAPGGTEAAALNAPSYAERAANASGKRSETREERVARLIREFRLEASTPVECVLFVADLKKEIDGYL